MAELQITAQPRTIMGRKVRQLRNQGLIPVVIYGKQVAAEPLQIDERSLERVLHSGGMSRLVEVAVDSKKHNALIREVRRHPVSHRLEHVDFYAVNMSEKQRISIPVEATGRASGIAGGIIMIQNLDHVMVEALPADIPANLVVDITPLTLDRPITVADLPALPGVAYLDEPDTIILSLSVTREEVEPTPTEGAAEPEVVAAKGKKDEDE
jgi:large subunit ribosomal protein L25